MTPTQSLPNTIMANLVGREVEQAWGRRARSGKRLLHQRKASGKTYFFLIRCPSSDRSRKIPSGEIYPLVPAAPVSQLTFLCLLRNTEIVWDFSLFIYNIPTAGEVVREADHRERFLRVFSLPEKSAVKGRVESLHCFDQM